MKNVFDKKADCCGCSACQNICPSHCISMKGDDEGFLYPVIDAEKCIDCGMCRRVCPLGNDNSPKSEIETISYAVMHKEESVREKSSSGGMFTAISDLILDNGGIVYGVKHDEEFNIIHARAENYEERDRFRGSKYVQSDLRDIFRLVEDDLKGGKKVLFTGTPCQCDGLKRFLKRRKCETNNLVLCDLVCHGVPSPMLWKEHIKNLEKRGRIKEYGFRSKIKGWRKSAELVIYENGKKDCSSAVSQEHTNLFFSHTALRPSCYECHYTTTERVSDITIADFWGIENTAPELDDNKGLSLVLINSEKGKAIFESVKEKLNYRECPLEKCLQPPLKTPAKPSPCREQFWQDYRRYGYVYITKKYCGVGFKVKLKKICRSFLKKTGLYEKATAILKGRK